jgi:hypothetical protein
MAVQIARSQATAGRVAVFAALVLSLAGSGGREYLQGCTHDAAGV